MTEWDKTDAASALMVLSEKEKLITVKYNEAENHISPCFHGIGKALSTDLVHTTQ
jgi:hypothetical protein